MDIVGYMERLVELPSVTLPSFDLPDNPLELSGDDVETIANQTRASLGMGIGPIPNVTRLLENHGVILALDNLDAHALDSLTYRTVERPYIIVALEKGTAVRWRYDSAHELGHLVLHAHVDQRTASRSIESKEIEAQAHRFAGAFLLPLEPFASDLYSASLDTLYNMKAKWRVSIGAMISRASKAELISTESAQRLWINYSRRGWRRSEPLDDRLEAETPRTLAEAQSVILQAGDGVEGLRRAVDLSDYDIEILCNLPDGFLANADAPRVVPRRMANVLPFPSSRG